MVRAEAPWLPRRALPAEHCAAWSRKGHAATWAPRDTPNGARRREAVNAGWLRSGRVRDARCSPQPSTGVKNRLSAVCGERDLDRNIELRMVSSPSALPLVGLFEGLEKYSAPLVAQSHPGSRRGAEPL